MIDAEDVFEHARELRGSVDWAYQSEPYEYAVIAIVDAVNHHISQLASRIDALEARNKELEGKS